MLSRCAYFLGCHHSQLYTVPKLLWFRCGFLLVSLLLQEWLFCHYSFYPFKDLRITYGLKEKAATKSTAFLQYVSWWFRVHFAPKKNCQNLSNQGYYDYLWLKYFKVQKLDVQCTLQSHENNRFYLKALSKVK